MPAAAAAAQSKKLRPNRARRRWLDARVGSVTIPCPALHARPNALRNNTVRSNYNAFRLQFGAPQIRQWFKPKPADRP
ncbi:MAG TPA: hypothetical protein VN362_07105, partial [Xanthobacteraceae bacterium]|nr:hypothetical protein [Xanthobacteraceae bacterium]